MVEDAVRRIAEACLEAPLRECPWTHVAQALGREFEDKCVLVSLAPGWSPMGPTFAVRVDREALMSATETLHRVNPWATLAARIEEGYFGLGYQEFTPAELRAGEFYNEWMRPAGLASDVVFGGFPVLREGCPELSVAVLSPTGTRTIDPEHIELGSRVMPYLKRTFLLIEKLGGRVGEVDATGSAGRSSEALRWSRAVLDRMQVAAMVTDASGRVTYANLSAEELLRRGDILRLSRGRVTAATSFGTRPLQEAIARAATNVAAKGGAWTTADWPDRDAFQLLVTPLPGSGPVPHQALLLALPTSDALDATPQILVRSFGLTRAEAGVVVELARLLNLREASTSLGISYETARTYFKRAAEKLGVRSQAAAIDCVRRLSLAR